jgi:hypothetical protein
VDEPAEFVAAPDLASGRSWWRRVGVWRLQGECPVRALGVVAVDVAAEHAFEVSAVEDQQPVEALCTHGTDEAFGDSVRLWCADRGADDPDLFAAEDLVEGAGVLAVAVAVADQETDLLLGEEEAEVASLLGDPASVGVGGTAGEVDAPVCRAR